MFALWYLSLAFDEMRKHFGWTFFGLFNTKKTGNNALDNKPSTSAKLPETKAKTPEKMPVPKVKPPPKAVPKVKPETTVKAPETSTSTFPAAVEKPEIAQSPASPVNEKPKVDSKPTVTLPAAAGNKGVNARNSGTMVCLTDALDNKLSEARKPLENGESLKVDIRGATVDFMEGEQQEAKRFKSIAASKAELLECFSSLTFYPSR